MSVLSREINAHFLARLPLAIVHLTKGEAVVFAVNSRPVAGARGDYRVKAAARPLVHRSCRTLGPFYAAVPMNVAPEDLATRRPVWEALSDMFLDTDVSLTRAWRIQRLAKSPYAVSELEHILVEEVYPACKFNLLSVAGEWSGFNPEWLEHKILRRRASPFRLLHGFNLGRIIAPRSAEWRATKVGIALTRASNESRVA